MLPLVSICIPTYKNSLLLQDAIYSAINQTHKEIEIIVFDDCSNDETEEVVKEIARKDSRIFYYKSDINLRPPKSWNECIKKANGDFFIVLPQDDILLPEFISKSLHALKHNPTIGFVQNSFINTNRFLKPISAVNYPDEIKLNSLRALEWQVKYKYCIPASIIINKNVVNEYFMEDFWDDWAYFARIAYRHGFIFQPEPLAVNRSHKDQLNFKLLEEEKPPWEYIYNQVMSLYSILDKKDKKSGNSLLDTFLRELSISMFFTCCKLALKGKRESKETYHKARKINKLLPFDYLIILEFYKKFYSKRIFNDLQSTNIEQVNQAIRAAIKKII